MRSNKEKRSAGFLAKKKTNPSIMGDKQELLT